MSTFRKRGDMVQAAVARNGVRMSRTFKLKREAEIWAAQVESEIIGKRGGSIPAHLTLSDLFDRYEREVSKGKKGEKWESVRLALFKRDRIAAVRLRVLDAPHVSDWQTRRLESVSGASVRRERNLMNHAFNIAVNEWKWLRENPWKGIRRPPESKPRDRIATDAELTKLEKAAGDKLRRVIVWAVETGMRAGEIAGLRQIYGNIAVLDMTKNGTGRSVPLSKKAVSVWVDGGFGLTAGSISAEFAKLTKAVGIEGLTFHDLRHTCATRLAKILNPYELSKMLGHKDLNMVLRVYYSQDAAETARKLG
jgi:integrase